MTINKDDETLEHLLRLADNTASGVIFPLMVEYALMRNRGIRTEDTMAYMEQRYAGPGVLYPNIK